MKKIFFIFSFLCILGGLFLPQLRLQKEADNTINNVKNFDQESIQSNSTILKNASSQLTSYERMQLISQSWDSNIEPAEEEEGELNKSEAAQLARKSLHTMYDNNYYPVTLTSGYDNWYKWDATLYRAIDTHFHSYAAYFWKIDFTRYDNSEQHTIKMMEDGTILFATTNATGKTIQPYAPEHTAGTSLLKLEYDQSRQLPIYDGETFRAEDLLGQPLVQVVGNSTITDLSQLKNAASKDSPQKPAIYLTYQMLSSTTGQYTYCYIPYEE